MVTNRTLYVYMRNVIITLAAARVETKPSNIIIVFTGAAYAQRVVRAMASNRGVQ